MADLTYDEAIILIDSKTSKEGLLELVSLTSARSAIENTSTGEYYEASAHIFNSSDYIDDVPTVKVAGEIAGSVIDNYPWMCFKLENCTHKFKYMPICTLIVYINDDI